MSAVPSTPISRPLHPRATHSISSNATVFDMENDDDDDEAARLPKLSMTDWPAAGMAYVSVLDLGLDAAFPVLSIDSPRSDTTALDEEEGDEDADTSALWREISLEDERERLAGVDVVPPQTVVETKLGSKPVLPRVISKNPNAWF
jgi:hypothetical protein